MNRNAAFVLTTLFAGSAFAGSPPHWMHDQAVAAKPSAQTATDSRDVGQNARGGDWKGSRQTELRRESPPARTNPPPVVRVTPPASNRNTPPMVASNDRNNDNRGERRGFNDPRPTTTFRPDHDSGRNDRSGNRGHDNRSDRDRNWHDRHGRDWRRDRGWYDQYRYNHYRYYNNGFYSRNQFSFGFYYAPFGYAPQSWFVGDYLPFAYFQDRYVLDRFDRFDLYDPPYGCDWIRVGNDALLVDRDSGYVLDVIHNLFW